MLILSRNPGQSIIINDNLKLTYKLNERGKEFIDFFDPKKLYVVCELETQTDPFYFFCLLNNDLRITASRNGFKEQIDVGFHDPKHKYKIKREELYAQDGGAEVLEKFK